MPGITPTGFDLKRLSDILADAVAQLATITDPLTGDSLQPDMSGSDPAMQVALVPLSQIADAWEALQEAYNQFDPDKAGEASLSALVELNGISRLAASASSVPLTLAGTPAAVIPAGQLVSDASGVYTWATQTAVTLNGSGSGTTTAVCAITGPVSIPPSQISTPVLGWASFTAGSVVLGRDLETPAQLRARRKASTMAPASGPVEALRANIANVPGVTYSRVYQNNTLTTDARGIPGKSIAPVVVGGLDADLGPVILARSGITASFFGSSSVTLTDPNGEIYTPAWTRPAPTDVWIYAEVRITNATVFPVDGVAQIAANILAYAQGGAPALGIADGFGSEGFGPGATVERSRLYTPLNFVPGHVVVTLALGTAPSPTGTADLAIAWDHYPRFTTPHIAVVVVP